VAEVESTEVDAVVSASGELAISPEAVRHLALAPGQHVRVAVSARPRRWNMYGVPVEERPLCTPTPPQSSNCWLRRPLQTFAAFYDSHGDAGFAVSTPQD
jgi:hypothetical protein